LLPGEATERKLPELEERLSRAFRKVEEILGRFQHKVEVYVVAGVDRNRDVYEPVDGVAWKQGRRFCTAVTVLASGDEKILVHELIHVRLRERDIDCPAWLEEGICDFFAGEARRTVFTESSFAGKDPAPWPDELDRTGVTRRSRADACVLVHYWHHHERLSVEQILHDRATSRGTWPTREVLVDYVKCLVSRPVEQQSSSPALDVLQIELKGPSADSF
jgi:hypothetical protein